LSFWEYSWSPTEKQRLKRSVPTIFDVGVVVKKKIAPSIKVKREDKIGFE
jgi:hypothetical protein